MFPATHDFFDSMSFLSRYQCLLALAAALGLFALESLQNVKRIEALSSREGGFSFVTPDKSSRTGYAHGVRNLIGSDRNDDLHWVINSQLAAERNDFRLREVDYDNAPDGRESHWSSVYSWWIRLLAWGEPSRMEWSMLVANALLGALALVVVALLFQRNFGGSSGVVVCLCFSGFIPLRDVFKVGMGDHHAAAIFAVMLMVSFLLVGLTRAVEGRDARLLAGASAAFGALAMWINVVSVLPVFLGIGVAAICIRIWVRSSDSVGLGNYFRLWCRCTAGLSLLAYLIEYAPSKFAWRLEVNHPLYSLALLGTGELLGLLFASKPKTRRRWIRGAFACVLALQLPLAIVLFRSTVFQVADPFLMAVHERYIMEFQGLWANVLVMGSKLRLLAMVLPLLLLPALTWLLFRMKRASPEFAGMLLAMGPACILFVLTLFQARWWSALAALTMLPLALAFAGGAKRYTNRSIQLFAGACLLPGLIVFGMVAFTYGTATPREEARVYERSIAHYLRARAADEEIVALASPDATTNLIYYGGAKGIGTFYWENNEGLKRAASMFAAPSLEIARARLSAAGVTHLLVYSWGGFEKEYLDLHRDFSEEVVDGKAFLMRLMEDQEIPQWLRPIPFQLPKEAKGMAVIYQVVPEMSPGQLASRRFEYLLEMGLGRAAHALEASLKDQDDLSAQVSLCRLLALQQRGNEFRVRLDKLRGAVVQPEADLLLEDEIRLAGVLLVASRAAEAKRHLEHALSRLDREALRELNAETIRHLWDLADALELDANEADLRTYSIALLPSRLRQAGK
ncbi:hypothetical protein [Pelagicoccus enzymogenes]|uniref:hypothetical protein n=1 Tax=Pelagicoccus enzymogenes TaxID=2773457 RepID=UPI00281286DB|nr:hypothetical protein [Pelagicoccus enzymogenes]